MFDVLVVGSSNMDTFLRVAETPRPGETVLGLSSSMAVGGKGANQAVASARAGAHTSFVSALGKDENGDLLRKALQDNDVDLSHLVTSETKTGLAYITLSEDGENSIVVIPGANQSKELREHAKDISVRSRVTLYSLEIDIEVIESVLAKTKGTITVLNAAPIRLIPKDVIRQIDILIVNEHEAAALSGQTSINECVEGLIDQVPVVVVTLGSKGAVVAERNRPPVHVQPYSVDAIDTTGAGDTFCGFFAAGLARGLSVVDATNEASIAGAIATTNYGAQSSIPFISDVWSVLNNV